VINHLLIPVPFNPKLVEAKLALKRIGPSEMPALAWDVLEAGLDGPSIRRVAALTNPYGWETDQILPTFMAEAGLKTITPREALIRPARQLAHQILSEGLDPLEHTRDFELLWIEADYAAEIQAAGTLDDEWYVAQYGGETEEQLREYARSVFLALVNTEMPDSSS
jgi:hypothetical protein